MEQGETCHTLSLHAMLLMFFHPISWHLPGPETYIGCTFSKSLSSPPATLLLLPSGCGSGGHVSILKGLIIHL